MPFVYCAGRTCRDAFEPSTKETIKETDLEKKAITQIGIVSTKTFLFVQVCLETFFSKA